MELMADERVRLVVLTRQRVRAALRLEAARRGVEMSELADAILQEALRDALREIDERQEEGGKKKGGGKS